MSHEQPPYQIADATYEAYLKQLDILFNRTPDVATVLAEGTREAAQNLLTAQWGYNCGDAPSPYSSIGMMHIARGIIAYKPTIDDERSSEPKSPAALVRFARILEIK